MSISDLRQSYKNAPPLTQSDCPENPLTLFRQWFENAKEAGILEPNAMCLSTIDTDGFPDGRIVLMKDLTEEGISFFTHYTSSKGQALANEPNAALTFYWDVCFRQVRLKGKVSKLSEEESDAYWHTRPYGSRLGAMASPQSQVIENRAVLTEGFTKLQNQHPEGEHIPRPKTWGGYRLHPERIEFWQGQTSRLHDRIVYTKDKETATWATSRLAP